jgi:hypothetical protein
LKIWLVCAFALLAACHPRELQPNQERGSGPSFRDIAPDTGLVFQHHNGATGQFYMPEIMGSGVALLDYDGDGDLDVFVIQGGPPDDPSRGSGNRLFRNELIPSGKLRFVDVTDEAGLRFSGYGMGVATGDFDNDGRTDLLVTNFGPNVLYRNLGNGKFQDVTADSPGLRKANYWSSSASFLDYDRDGWPDLIVLSYVDFSLKNNKKCSGPTGSPDYCTPIAYRPLAATLFHNEHGQFVDVTAKAGLDQVRGPGLGVTAVDVDQDGWPDIFVANDTSANHLWMNQRNGTFREAALERGVAYGEEGQPKAGMGVAAGDYDNDGREDLIVLNLMREGASLFRNDAKGFFSDVSLASGIHALTLPYTGFGVGWFDFDNDGCLDLFFANGAVTLRERQPGAGSPYAEKNLLLRNPCSAGRFVDVTAQAGEVLQRMEVSRGAALGDIDNDGRVDIVVTTNDGPLHLLHNETRGGAWLSVDTGQPGSKVGLFRPGQPPLWRRAHTDGSYLSASDPRVHFGLGTSTRIEKLVVEWADGARQEQAGPAGNRQIIVRKRTGSGSR